MADGEGNRTDSTSEMVTNAPGIHVRPLAQSQHQQRKRQGKCERGSTSEEETLALMQVWQIGRLIFRGRGDIRLQGMYGIESMAGSVIGWARLR